MTFPLCVSVDGQSRAYNYEWIFRFAVHTHLSNGIYSCSEPFWLVEKIKFVFHCRDASLHKSEFHYSRNQLRCWFTSTEIAPTRLGCVKCEFFRIRVSMPWRVEGEEKQGCTAPWPHNEGEHLAALGDTLGLPTRFLFFHVEHNDLAPI